MRRALIAAVTVLGILSVVGPVRAADPWDWVKLQYSEAYYRARFKAADTNGDGFLSPAEAKAAQLRWECFKDSARWRHADANNDGQLSLDECIAEKRFELALARKGLHHLHEWLNGRLATPIIDLMERNQMIRIRDGIANGSLTLEEAQELLAGEKSIRDAEAAAKADRVLTPEERESLRNSLKDMSRAIYDEKHDTDGVQLPPPGPNATPGINERQYIQACRTAQGIRSGELTIAEARGLIADQKQIQEMKKDAKSDGKVTLEERKDIHKALNDESRKIFQEKHDDEKSIRPRPRPLPRPLPRPRPRPRTQ